MGRVRKETKLELEKGTDYEEKKNNIDRYKKVSSVLLKKDSTRIEMKPGYICNIHNKKNMKKRRTAKILIKE